MTHMFYVKYKNNFSFIRYIILLFWAHLEQPRTLTWRYNYRTYLEALRILWLLGTHIYYGIVFYDRLIRLNEDVYAGPDVPTIYTISYMHYSTIGTLVGIAVGLAVSLLFPEEEQDVDPKLLTPFIRKFVYPKYMTETVKNGRTNNNKTETYELVSQDTKLWWCTLYMVD